MARQTLEDALTEIRQASEAMARWQEVRDRAIRSAYDHPEATLRTIASAAGVSKDTIARLVE